MTSAQKAMDQETNENLARLLYSVKRMADIYGAILRQLGSEIDLTASQLNILLAVGEHGTTEGVSVRDVADYLRVSGPFITHETNKLEQRQLVAKRSNPFDGRSTLLKL